MRIKDKAARCKEQDRKQLKQMVFKGFGDTGSFNQHRCDSEKFGDEIVHPGSMLFFCIRHGNICLRISRSAEKHKQSRKGK